MHSWLKRTITTWPNEDDTLPTISYEDIDVMTMELPPGWRGYGAKNYIDHPDTPKRLEEIEKIKASLGDADRYRIQETLMKYSHLLPEKYRERNERLTER